MKFTYGFEIEFIVKNKNYNHIKQELNKIGINNIKIVDPEYGKLSKKDFQYYYIENDASVKGKYHELPCEITSMVFNDFETFQKHLYSIFDWMRAQSYLYTNNTTGLHINIGFDESPDFVKLITLFDEKHISNKFGRLYNNTCSLVSSKIKEIKNKYNKNSLLNYLRVGDANLLSEIFIDDIYYSDDKPDKYYTVNLVPYLEMNDYIEFRVIGNADYHLRQNDIEASINHFKTIITDSTSVNNHKKYLKRLYKMIEERI